MCVSFTGSVQKGLQPGRPAAAGLHVSLPGAAAVWGELHIHIQCGAALHVCADCGIYKLKQFKQMTSILAARRCSG